MSPLKNTRVLLGVTGSVACYRALDVVRGLRQEGATVRVLPTKAALAFVTEMAFEAVSGARCLTAALQMENGLIPHVEEAHHGDLFVVCPASADSLAKLAHGFADEALYSTFLSYRGPVIVAPAMETHMWEHPATQANVALLRERGTHVLGPDEGPLASGRTGKGRLIPVEEVLEGCRAALTLQDLAGKRILITAGPTAEDIDPVRFLSNRSSGKMGVALAQGAVRRGAQVTLVHGPMAFSVPQLPGLSCCPVRSAQEMHDEVHRQINSEPVDAAILCAAVADYRPAERALQKLKKEKDALGTLVLQRTPDILASLGALEKPPLLMGFAAETENVQEHALDKLRRKNADWIAANDVGASDIGFGADANRMWVAFRDGRSEVIETMPKPDVAQRLLDFIAEAFSPSSP